MDCKERKTIDIGIDIETLSTLPTAAITEIAARVFTFDEEERVEEKLHVRINPMSCILAGFHVEEDTCAWWSNRDDEVKEKLMEPNGTWMNIKPALHLFAGWLGDLKGKYECDELRIWMEGTDFDGSILRHAFRKTFPERGRDAVPWNYRALRDARTFILEGLRMVYGEVDDPFSLIPKPEKPFLHHDPMGDVDQMIWNVRHVNELLAIKNQPTEKR